MKLLSFYCTGTITLADDCVRVVVSVPSPFPFSRLHSGGKGSGKWPMLDASERYAIIALYGQYMTS